MVDGEAPVPASVQNHAAELAGYSHYDEEHPYKAIRTQPDSKPKSKSSSADETDEHTDAGADCLG